MPSRGGAVNRASRPARRAAEDRRPPLFPPRPGTLLALPTECRIPGITGFEVDAKPGDRLRHAHASVDNYASALAVGTSRAEVERVVATLKSRVESEAVIEPDAAAETPRPTHRRPHR
ncbi:hypothetical protein ACWGN5_26840 [Streptomyces sp. NPDC055815]